MKTAAALSLIATIAFAPALAQAKPPLRDVARIDDALMMVAIADDLRKRCDAIDARMIAAFSYLRGLKAEARGMGYTEEEIEDYVSSDEEKTRMKRKADAWLATKGVSRNDRAAYCSFGQQEIAKGSQIGALLRSR